MLADAAPAAPAKVAKRKSSGKAKKPSSHPKYSKMIQDALKALKVRYKSLRFIQRSKFITKLDA